MKVAIICDTHFGVRNDSPLFLNYFLDFFENQFFPYLRDHNIKHVLHLGDLMDRRKFVNFQTLAEVKKRFISNFDSGEFELWCLLGNHDTYYKNTNEINSINQLFNNTKINIVEKPINLQLGSLSIALVPWINKENYETSLEFIKTTTSPFIMGHFELTGFEVLRGVKHEDGMSPAILSRFETVYSGHFHCKQSEKNVSYLGTPYQITFSDLKERKGFHILDTETRELEFIENTNRIFYSIRYNDAEKDMLKTDFSKYKNSFVKLIVENKTKPYIFDKFLDSLYGNAVASLNIIEENNIELSSEQTVDNTKDTLTIINSEIDAMEEVQNKNKLKKIIHELYMESLSQ